MKTKIFNLIVLDESGSMQPVTEQTVGGCNEVINSIRSSQEKYADTQEHYLSIYAFQSQSKTPSRYLLKNVPVAEARAISREDYRPWGCTPLYDAVGSTLADLRAKIGGDVGATASVTIITDGMENSSTHYDREKVASMISALKELGWNFNFIGAEIDARRVAMSINIDISNTLQFDRDAKGTSEMWEKYKSCRESYSARFDDCCCNDGSEDEEVIREKRRKASKGFFDLF